MAGATAGMILGEPDPPNANWRRCDGSFIVNVKFGDYWRRVMFSHGGAGIGGMRLPDMPGCIVCVDDDPDYPTVTDLPAMIDLPVVTQDGATLRCTMGNWQNTPTGYAYQWEIAGGGVGGNTATLAVTAADEGLEATCIVTASNAFGATAAPPSDPLTIGPIA